MSQSSSNSNDDGNTVVASELSIEQLKMDLHALHVTHIPKRLCTKTALSSIHAALQDSGILYIDIEPIETPELDGSDSEEEEQEGDDTNDNDNNSGT